MSVEREGRNVLSERALEMGTFRLQEKKRMTQKASNLCTNRYPIRAICSKRPLCWKCGKFMADGPLKGIFRCRRCGTEHVDRQIGFDVLERLRRAPKEKILLHIQKRKAVMASTLHRHFPDLPVREALKELEQEGKIEIQQSGFAGHSLMHGKLVVIHEVKR